MRGWLRRYVTDAEEASDELDMDSINELVDAGDIDNGAPPLNRHRHAIATAAYWHGTPCSCTMSRCEAALT